MSTTGKPISQKFIDVLNRLDSKINVKLEEVYQIPEIAEALIKAADVPETINLPGRDKIREGAFNKLVANKGFAYKKDVLYNEDVRKDHKAFLVLGLPSSGKSSVITDRLLKENNAFLLDSDEAKKIFKEYKILQLDCTEIAKAGGVLNCISWQL